MEPQDYTPPTSRNIKELVALINSLFAKQPTIAALASNVALLASAKAGEIALDATGLATITFSSPYSVKPVMQYSYIEAADAQPIILKTVSFVVPTTGANAGKWTGVNIKGKRMRKLPTIPTLSVGALLTVVVAGFNVMVNLLTEFDVSNGSASGVVVQWTARIPA